MSPAKKLANVIQQNPWIHLLKLPEFGRGLISALDIPQGTVIQTELPLASSPPLQKSLQEGCPEKSSWCHLCLRPGGSGDVPGCCDQGEMMKERYGREILLHHVQAAVSTWEPLMEYAALHREKFPLLVSRIACMRIGRMLYGDNTFSLDDRDMESLCYITGSEIPDQWRESYRALLECFQDQTQVRNMISIDWYADMMRRVHPNAFRVDLINTPELARDYSAALKRMFVQQESEASCGSAIYLVSSLFNHSCTPNVEPSFPYNNHIIEMKALRDIQKNEHLCISYIDSVNLSYEDRQQKLFHGYGFQCQCEKCLEERR